MPRGDSFTAIVPVVGETVGTTYATYVNACLQELIDLVEEYITVAEIDIDDDLSMNNYAIGDVDYLELINQGAALSGGANARRLNAYGGELYWCDGSGNSVKITNGGILSGVSGDIGGDYGDGSEAVTYTASTNTYEFTDDDSNPAIIDASEYLHEEYILMLPAACGQPIESDGDGEWIFVPGGGSAAQRWQPLDTCADEASIAYPIPLKVGDRIKEISLYVTDDSSKTITMSFQRDAVNGTGASTLDSDTSDGLGTAYQELCCDGLTTVISSTYTYSIVVKTDETPGAFSPIRIYGAKVTYDRI